MRIISGWHQRRLACRCDWSKAKDAVAVVDECQGDGPVEGDGEAGRPGARRLLPNVGRNLQSVVLDQAACSALMASITRSVTSSMAPISSTWVRMPRSAYLATTASVCSLPCGRGLSRSGKSHPHRARRRQSPGCRRRTVISDLFHFLRETETRPVSAVSASLAGERTLQSSCRRRLAPGQYPQLRVALACSATANVPAPCHTRQVRAGARRM